MWSYFRCSFSRFFRSRVAGSCQCLYQTRIPPRNDKQYDQAYDPVDDSLATVAIDLYYMETRRLRVRHGAGVDVPV